MARSSPKRLLRTLSPFLAWPSFCGEPPFSLAPMVHGLERSQWEHSEALAAGQQAQLRLLLEWAVNNVAYYRNRRSAGYADILARIRRRPDEFDAAWAQLPVLTKVELRANGASLYAASLPAGHRPLIWSHTSGSTGIPVKVAKTSLDQTLWKALTVREHLWRRRDFSKRLGVIRFRDPTERMPGGQDFPTWGSPVAELFTTGRASVAHVGHPIGELAAWLKRVDPHYLLTSPSVAASLLDEFGEGPPRALEEVRLMDEPVDADLERRLLAQWKVQCCQLYSASEVGYIAFCCAEHSKLHVQTESIRVEILDAAGQPCAIGATGRVVVTPLHNLATPLIRYEIGDFATVGGPCGCGRAHPVIERVCGRVRNLARTPDGRRFWPVDLDEIEIIAPVRQAQYVQTALDHIDLRVALDRPLTPAEAAQAVALVREVLGYPFAVDIVVVDRIERGPTGKFEQFLTLLPE